MASLKLCLQTGPKKQIRRSRIDSLADFSFTALLNVVADTFPGLPSTIELGYEDDEGELITLASDSDVQECVSVMDVAGKKTLRIEIICNEISTAAAGLDIDTSEWGSGSYGRATPFPTRLVRSP